MDVIYGLFIALSMYSKIPVPVLEWKKSRLRYVMCWFPFVGLVCGLLLWLWLWLAGRLEIHPGAAGLVGSCIPLWVTGGIHMDGFLDTVDARSSYGDKEKKLKILKDPHTGAFALIGGGVYLLFYGACMIQLGADMSFEKGRLAAAAFWLVFPLERAFSGLSVACFPCAKDSGLARTFSDGASKGTVSAVMVLWILACFGIMAVISGMLPFIVTMAFGLGIYGYYWQMSKKEFGGITGDLAGWFLQMFELACLAALTISARAAILAG